MESPIHLKELLNKDEHINLKISQKARASYTIVHEALNVKKAAFYASASFNALADAAGSSAP